MSFNTHQHRTPGVNFRHVIFKGETAAVDISGISSGDFIIQLIPAGTDIKFKSVQHGGIFVINGTGSASAGNGYS